MIIQGVLLEEPSMFNGKRQFQRLKVKTEKPVKAADPEGKDVYSKYVNVYIWNPEKFNNSEAGMEVNFEGTLRLKEVMYQDKLYQNLELHIN